MVVRGVQREGNILIHPAALRPVLIVPADHGALHRHHRNTALVAGGISAVPIQSPGSICLIKSAVGIIRLHGIAVFRADAVCLHHQFIAAALTHIKGVQRVCHLPVLPGRRIPFVVGAVPLAERHEHRLVIVAGESCGFVILYDRPFAAALTAGADFQRLGRFHHERLVIAAHAVGGADRRRRFQRPRISRILRMVLIERHRSRDRPCTERGRGFLLIPNPTRLCGMLRAETGRFQYARGVVRLCPQGAGHVIRHVHPLPALVVQADAACRSNAIRSTSGSSLPRTEALRRIPRHAFGLK